LFTLTHLSPGFALYLSGKHLFGFSTALHLGLRKLRMSILSTSKFRRLSLGFPTLNDVFPGFELGDFVVLRGNAASFMAFVLTVRAQLPVEHGGLESSAVFVDGGNMFSPYSIAEIARDCSLDSRAVLERVHVSRAFTAHQLSSLILEKLHLVLRRTKAGLLVVSDISSLFSDRDVPKIEASDLFMKVCSKLSRIASEKQVIVVVSYFLERRSRHRFFDAALFRECSTLIKLSRRGKIFTFSLESHPRVKPFIMNFTADQTPLNHVYGGASFGKNGSIL
jgi:hypothetical protein